MVHLLLMAAALRAALDAVVVPEDMGPLLIASEGL
jgi:hypothetical protein